VPAARLQRGRPVNLECGPASVEWRGSRLVRTVVGEVARPKAATGEGELQVHGSPGLPQAASTPTSAAPHALQAVVAMHSRQRGSAG